MSPPNLLSFFIDPILRGPTIGCMFMCLAASLIGVVVFLRKQSLIGEVLSHAAYPGMILGVIIAGSLAIVESDEFFLSLLALSFALLTAIGALWLIQTLIKRVNVPADAALCFVLSTFFGVGLTLTSEVQFSFTPIYKQILTYFYGQAATMSDIHIIIYAGFAAITLLAIILFYKEIQTVTFDRQYAKSLGISIVFTDALIVFLAAAAIIIGIRSVGIVLVSAMLIAPAVAARQFTQCLSYLFLFAALCGIGSGYFGNYLSVYFTDILSAAYPTARIILPTGPMIVLTATAICCLAILFASERGLIVRIWRMRRFRIRCLSENILKMMWQEQPERIFEFEELTQYQTISRFELKMTLRHLLKKGWLQKTKTDAYQLTEKGALHAKKIIRLHRLWEVYLANYLEVAPDRVHRNAEEMEHILTPELEEKLTLLLNDPKHDPHQQPIPSREILYGH